MLMRVFISSTCYDLIDLRAELETFFRDAGMTPILSDSLNSEFEVSSDKNSIGSCLANVGSSEYFVVILSKRYGPSLKNAGYEDVSATHLEYREAVRANKPVLFFARDRLMADYDFWRKNSTTTPLKLPWCQETGMFALLDERRKFCGDQNNWVWVFRHSLEIKQRLLLEFKDTFARAQATRLFEMGRVPFLELAATYGGHFQSTINLELKISNLSDVVAVRPRLRLDSPAGERVLNSIGAQKFYAESIPWANHRGSNLSLDVRLTYSILEGHQFCDEGTLKILYWVDGRQVDRPSITYELKKRKYLGAEVSMLPTI
jgi:hypothetical protein